MKLLYRDRVLSEGIWFRAFSKVTVKKFVNKSLPKKVHVCTGTVFVNVFPAIKAGDTFENVLEKT